MKATTPARGGEFFYFDEVVANSFTTRDEFDSEQTMGRFSLRRLRANDAAAFKVIRLQALFEHPEAFGAAWEDENVRPVSLIAERLEGGHVIAGVTAEGKIVGTIGILRSTGQKTQHIATIWGMYVSPLARGKGLGRALLDAAVAEMGPLVKSVRLCVEANNNPAIKLYESAGFKRWALDTEALKVGDKFHDEILMRLDINQMGGALQRNAVGASEL